MFSCTSTVTGVRRSAFDVQIHFFSYFSYTRFQISMSSKLISPGNKSRVRDPASHRHRCRCRYRYRRSTSLRSQTACAPPRRIPKPIPSPTRLLPDVRKRKRPGVLRCVCVCGCETRVLCEDEDKWDWDWEYVI